MAFFGDCGSFGKGAVVGFNYKIVFTVVKNKGDLIDIEFPKSGIDSIFGCFNKFGIPTKEGIAFFDRVINFGGIAVVNIKN